MAVRSSSSTLVVLGALALVNACSESDTNAGGDAVTANAPSGAGGDPGATGAEAAANPSAAAEPTTTESSGSSSAPLPSVGGPSGDNPTASSSPDATNKPPPPAIAPDSTGAPASTPSDATTAPPTEPDPTIEPPATTEPNAEPSPSEPTPTEPSPSDPAPGGSVFPPTVTTPRLMIVGDSISAGPGCYKKYLDQQLQSAGLTNYEFVGAYDDDCGGGIRHSAVSCTTSGQYTQATFTVPSCFAGETFPGMATLVMTHSPDLILLQLGVNDVWSGGAPIDPILDNYETLIEQARAHNPNVVVVVAQIHKIITDNCANTASTTNAEELITAIPGWAAGVTTNDSPVLVADLWTNSDPREADDCVHPNDAGAQRMGLNWFNALKDLLQ